MSKIVSTDIILQKEEEWKGLLINKLDRTERENVKLNEEIKDVTSKLVVLEQDFKHNLRLLQDRDDEISELENENQQLKEKIETNESKIGDVCIANDKLKFELNQEKEKFNELKARMKDLSMKNFNDLEALGKEKDKRMEESSNIYNQKIKDLERKIIQIQSDSDEKQQSLVMEIQDTLKSRENQLQKDAQNLHSEIMSYELKYRLVCRELDAVKANKAELHGELANKEEKLREFERRMAEEDFEHHSQLSILKMTLETKEVKFIDREKHLLAQIEDLTKKNSFKSDQLKKKGELGKKLQKDLEEAWQQKEKEKGDLLQQFEKEKSEKEKLEDILESEKQKLKLKETEIDRYRLKFHDELIGKDGELRNMKVASDELRKELHKKHEEVLELRSELEFAIGKDMSETKRREEDRLTWESRLEQARVEEMSKVEQMILQMKKARDSALGELEVVKNQLKDAKKHVKLCPNCTGKSNPTVNMDSSYSPDSSNAKLPTSNRDKERELYQLREQNQQLKLIIERMSETVDKQSQSESPSRQRKISPKRDKQEKIVSNQNVATNKHIENLAERNRKLQQERIEVMAHAHKLQARLDQSDTEKSQMKEQLRQRDTELSQLQFQLDSLQRHTGLDVRNLRRRITELETELAVSRKESEEYFKGNLELGRINEELQSELTQLKSEQYSKVPSLNFGAQELLISQLQREIEDLRIKAQSGMFKVCRSNGDDEEEFDSEKIALKKKLKAAANHIKNLSTEKQVLIQLSNRLRAELNKAGIKLPASKSSGEIRLSSHHTSEHYIDQPSFRRNENGQEISNTIEQLQDKLKRLDDLQKNLKQMQVQQDSNGYFEEESDDAPGESVKDAFKMLDESHELSIDDSLLGQQNANMLAEVKGQKGVLWQRNKKSKLIKNIALANRK